MLVIVRVNGHLKFLGLFIQMNIQIDTHTNTTHIPYSGQFACGFATSDGNRSDLLSTDNW